MESDKNIFDGLESLGFKDTENIVLFEEKEEKEQEVKEAQQEEINEENYLYDKSVTCPICDNEFKARVVKTNATRIKEKDKDLFIRYKGINPYFYDVWICNTCGYGAMKVDFNKIKKVEKEFIRKEIATKWKGKEYPSVYDINISIERYKISLLNSTVMRAKSSRKAINCLKIAWMYRLLEDLKNEQLFIEQALLGFNDAYFNEDFPIYGMDKFTTMYLIGELHRRLGNYNEALKQFGEVITSQIAGRKIKDLAWEQKELIKEVMQENKESLIDDFNENDDIQDDLIKENKENKKKKGLFKRFFK